MYADDEQKFKLYSVSLTVYNQQYKILHHDAKSNAIADEAANIMMFTC